MRESQRGFQTQMEYFASQALKLAAEISVIFLVIRVLVFDLESTITAFRRIIGKERQKSDRG